MTVPDTAMILAAGLGIRMRPLTDALPKPLVPVAGAPLIDRIIDRLVDVGVKRIVVNAHYKADMLAEHLAGRRDVEIDLSRETSLLDSGGGIRNALPLLGETFFVVNSDIVWLNGKVSPLQRLARAWDETRFDALLLMQRTTTALGYDGPGDFIVAPDGSVRRREEREVAPHLFAGIELLHRRLFDDAPDGAFSLNLLWDRAIETGRIGALVHDGEWYHVGTPVALAATEERLRSHRIER
jgi:MurNAc alpha-1-phosphate uridylyltransferase